MTVDGSTIRSRIRNLLRSPSNKLRNNRKENLAHKVTLERVLGITASGNSGLTCDPSSGLVAYPAGCVVVLLNPKKNQQRHILSTSRKTITALSFSPDGKYLVTGESGHLPAVRVWGVAECRQVSELQEHQYGVSCVSFSPDGERIVSVGDQHDMVVNVWAWKKDTVIATNKVSSKVTGVSFSEDSSYFVTAGNRHVKFWYLDHSKPTKAGAPVPLLGRSGLLGELRDNFFCDVACGRGSRADATFCITSSGLLCEFNGKRMLDKWVDLRTSVARSLSVSEEMIFCGCADGTVRAFNPADLRFVCTLPRPHPLGHTPTQASHLFSDKTDARYPDSVAVSYDPVSHWLSCVYNDHSLYVWDVRDLRRVGKVHSALYHASCVWDLQVLPEVPGGTKSGLSSGTFLSCSEDNTVRLWSADDQDLLRVIYVDGNSAALLDAEGTASGSTEKADGPTAETRTGVRTVCVSPDGKHLASGGRSGTLRVHDLTSMEEILKVEAHDSEILCLEYSKPETGLKLLATAGRDRLIHVLDAEEDYGLVQTLDEHSSSISAVRFAANENKVTMISCGADKSIYFRTAHRTDKGTEFRRSHHVVRKTTLYDMAVDPTCKYAAVGCQDRRIRLFHISSGKQKKMYKGSQSEDGSLLRVQTDPSGLYVATSCTDKSISIFDFLSGECVATMFGHSEIVTGLKFTNDCKHLISVSADSCIFVWRLAPELTINMRERLSQLRHVPHTPPCKTSALRREIYSAPVQGSFSSESDQEEEEEQKEEEEQEEEEEEEPDQDDSLDQEQTPASTSSDSSHDEEEDTGASDDGPDWASKMEGGDGPVALGAPEAPAPARPRRRWSCRMGSLELMVKSMLDLRQLDAFSSPSGSSHRRASASQLRERDAGSASSLQGASELKLRVKRRRLHPPSSAMSLASRATEENLLYPEDSDDRTSLQGSDNLNGSLGRGGRSREPQDSQSPDSACSVDYYSRQSSPIQAHGDSEGVEPLSSDDDLSDLEDEEEDDVVEEEEEKRGKMKVTSMDEAMRTVTAPPELAQQASLKPNSTVEESRAPVLSMSARFLARGSDNRRTPPFAKVPERKPGPGGPSARPLVSKVRPLMEWGQGKKNPGDRSLMSPRPKGTKVEEGDPDRGPVPGPHSQKRRPLGGHLWRMSSPLTRGPAAGLQKSQSVQNITSEGLHSPTPCSCRGEAPLGFRDVFDPSRALARPPSPPSVSPRSPSPWESLKRRSSRSYMSPTASSEAKTCRAPLPREDLCLGTPPGHAPLSPGGRESQPASPRRTRRSSSGLPEAEPLLLSSSPTSRSLASLSPFSSPSCPGQTGSSPSPPCAAVSPNPNSSFPPKVPPSQVPLPKQPLCPHRSLRLDWSTVSVDAPAGDPVCDWTTAWESKPALGKRLSLPTDLAHGRLGNHQPASVSPASLPAKQERVSELERAMATPGQKGPACKDRPLVSVQAHTPPMSAPQCGVGHRRRSSLPLAATTASLPPLHPSISLPLPQLHPSLHPCPFVFWPVCPSLSVPPCCLEEPSVTLETCRQAAADLHSSLRKASLLYTMVLGCGSAPGEDEQEMKKVLAEALGLVRTELDSLPQPTSDGQVREGGGGGGGVKGEGEKTLALLEQYSELLLKSVEKRLDNKT